MKHRAIISLGSNVPDKERIVSRALRQLGDTIVAASQPYIDPVDNDATAPYVNIVAIIDTHCDHLTLAQKYKTLEVQAGRTPQSKQLGLIELDIDIVIYDNEIKRPADYTSPHFQKGYHQLQEKYPNPLSQQ
ncbi:MAG: 2-amino-4-hydroxy-6-hydroxymethyldihydropteridine diphosphokinase [Clostridiales bacterium]|nr:2-amino-4-hydroxy-6-hydroxymethyldihydropteridine diphosphokinase [Clostridiales bacterium]